MLDEIVFFVICLYKDRSSSLLYTFKTHFVEEAVEENYADNRMSTTFCTLWLGFYMQISSAAFLIFSEQRP